MQMARGEWHLVCSRVQQALVAHRRNVAGVKRANVVEVTRCSELRSEVHAESVDQPCEEISVVHERHERDEKAVNA